MTGRRTGTRSGYKAAVGGLVKIFKRHILRLNTSKNVLLYYIGPQISRFRNKSDLSYIAV